MIKTAIVLFVGIVSISFASIFIKFCDDVPALMIATYRLTVASVILVAIFKMRGHSLRHVHRDDVLLSLAGGVFLYLHFITWITSLKYTSVASSVVLVTTNPIFVGIFSYLILKERQPAELVIGIVLSFLGSALIALADSGLSGLTIAGNEALAGDGLALAGAVMASGYLIVGSKVRERLDLVTYVTIVYTISAVLALATSVVLGVSFVSYKPTSYIFMVLLAIVPQLIGHTSFNWALKHLKTSMIAVTILGEPVGATILAYMFFQEGPGTLQFVGIALIFAAVIVASRKGTRAQY